MILDWAETSGHAVRRLDPATGEVVTLAGGRGRPAVGYRDGPAAAALFNRPHGLARRRAATC